MRREDVIGPYIVCTIIFTIYMFMLSLEPVSVEIPKAPINSPLVIEIEIETIEEETTIETTKDSTIEYSEENDISSTNQGSTWYITAYCPCSYCCGQYAAMNLHYDENGNEYHTGASGETLIAGYSVASSLPFGTKIYIEGIGEVCVADRGGAVSGNHLDLYFATHEEALQFATGTYSGYIIGG